MPIELTLVKFIADSMFRLFGLKTQQRLDFSEYLSQIADMLSEFGPAFREGDRQKMRSLAAQTQVIAEKFGQVAKGAFDEKEIAGFKEKLGEAYDDKVFLMKPSTDKKQQQKLDDIAQTAGVFRGVSISLKATAKRIG